MPEDTSILIVDDQPMTLATLKAALESEGYEIYAATDGIDALEVLRVFHVDLIIADIAMPRMNGYQLFQIVRQDSRWVQIPFIFISARSMESDVRYGKELGADDYLAKPFQLEDLRATIAGKLRRSQQQNRWKKNTSQDTMLDEDILVIGALRIQPQHHRVTVAGLELMLSVKEFALLLHLARHQGQVVKLEDLCLVTHNLSTNKVEAGSLLYPLIRSLRMKLQKHNFNQDKIQTVRGVGYILI